jgi:hypothetical protein
VSHPNPMREPGGAPPHAQAPEITADPAGPPATPCEPAAGAATGPAGGTAPRCPTDGGATDAGGVGERAGLGRPRPRRCLARKQEGPTAPTPQQRLLLLHTWRRSGLPARDFAALVGISRHTLYAWKHKFETEGPAGLDDKARGGPTGSRLPEVTRRAILMMKEANPEAAPGDRRAGSRRPLLRGGARGVEDAQGPGGGPRRPAGPARSAQGTVLSDGPGRWPALQLACRGRARHPDGGRR